MDYRYYPGSGGSGYLENALTMTAKVKKINTISWHQVGVDGWLCLAFFSLLFIGIVMVASASIAVAENNTADSFYYVKRHLLFIAVSLCIGFVVLKIPVSWLHRLSRPALIIAIAMLIIILIPGIGVEVNGARRWLNLGFSRFQAVEAMKLAMIMSLAAYMMKHEKAVQQSMLGVLRPLLTTTVIVGLLLIQPDFGSGVLLMAVTLTMIFIAGARFRDLSVIGLLSGSAIMVLAWAEPYRVKRLVNFTDPWQDPFNAGFQLVQALIAVGRGEFTGVGIGASIQKLFYLPEAHTDFIFAVYAEEMGFIGVLLMVSLFLLLFVRIFKVSRQAFINGQVYAGYLCAGIVIWLALQTFLSMGVNLGLLPTKGLTLPFISSGGSAIMMNILAITIVLRVSYENRKLNYRVPTKEAKA